MSRPSASWRAQSLGPRFEPWCARQVFQAHSPTIETAAGIPALRLPGLNYVNIKNAQSAQPRPASGARAKRALRISASCLICFRITTEYYLWGCKMNSNDFEGMPLDDLWSLHEQICSVLETKIKDEKRKLEHRLDELSRTSVAAPADIRQHRPSPKGEPKYRNPEDPSMTWSGRGIHAG